jgi:hypothetical protein
MILATGRTGKTHSENWILLRLTTLSAFEA